MSRFTLRDLFWLTLVVALGCAWWVERGRAKDAALWQKHADYWRENAEELARIKHETAP